MIDLSQLRPLPESYAERAEHRPCKGCGEPIQPGQIYLPDGPLHIACGREKR